MKMMGVDRCLYDISLDIERLKNLENGIWVCLIRIWSFLYHIFHSRASTQRSVKHYCILNHEPPMNVRDKQLYAESFGDSLSYRQLLQESNMEKAEWVIQRWWETLEREYGFIM